MKRKAQVKMAENIAVILLFIFLVAFGLVFYTAYKRGSLKDKAVELEIENSIEVASRVGFLPELQCSQDAIQQQNCIDLLKLRAVDELDLFNDPIHKSQVYFGLLRYSTIVLKKIYPPSSTPEIYELYDFKKPNATTQEFVPIPIVIYNPIDDKSAFGVLEVTVYG